MTSIYLTDEELFKLKRFCDENQCTQYSALKSALKELISDEHVKRTEETTSPKPSPILESSEKKYDNQLIDILRSLIEKAT